MFLWKSPSDQVLPGLEWQSEQSMAATPPTETPLIVTGALNTALWSMGCRSDAAFSTMPVGRICSWQSKQLMVGCWNPEVVNTLWNWPGPVMAPASLTVWQSAHFEVFLCAASPASRTVARHWPPTTVKSTSTEHILVPSMATVHRDR